MIKRLTLLFAIVLCATTGMADPNTPPHLTTWDDLDALVSDRYTGMTNAVYLYPPFPFPFFVHGGYATLDDNGDLIGATNLFVSSTLLDVPIWHVWVNETQLTERVWQIMGASNTCFRTNTVPSSFDPQAWVRVNYGQPPSYLTGTKLNQWYANRDRSRLHLDFKLIASNDWPTLQAAFAAAATNTPTPDTPPPTMPLDTNRLAFAGIETSYSNVTTRLWIYTPTSEQVDVFARTALTPVTNLWELRGTLDATAPFDTWEASSVDLPVAFFHAALAGIDTDGDGLPDGREILALGTDPNALDTDGDGLGDFTEIYRYGTSALLADTDGDGLSDYEEIALGSDPLSDDTDGDGLTDLTEEYETFTLFADSDTDNDGLTDYEEIVLYNTSPFGSDTDCDGLDDFEEVTLGTSPTLADTDGDGICDYTEVYLGQYLSPTDPTDADDDIDNDAFNNLLEYQNFWLMTSPTNGYESAKYQLICIQPGSNSILYQSSGPLISTRATFALGNAGTVSSILRIPPTKEVGGTMVKRLYHTGSPHLRLDGTPLSELSSPIMVPDTTGTVNYCLSALPSNQGNTANFWLGNDQGATNTPALTCYIPKVTTTEFRDRNGTRHVDVTFGATGTFVVAWSPDPHHAAGVHISPTVWPTYVSGVPLLTSRDYLLARVTGDTTNFTASLNYYRYDSARLARRGLILPVGKHLVAVGLDWNLDGQLQDEEISMACDVYVVTADLDADTDRDGTIEDDDEENEDAWTLSRGTLVYPRYMNIPNPPPQFTNLSQIIITGSACPTGLSFRLKAVDTETKNWTEFVDGTNAGSFNSSGYFAVSQWPTNLYVAATETRKCTSGSPVCFTIDLEAVLSGQVLITDRIRLAVAPVILPSECNAAERIYATSTNFLGVIANLEIIPSTANQWVQDQVKFVKTQHHSNTNNNLAITLHHPYRGNLETILQNTNMMPCCQWYVGGEGGNIMATPPLPDAPYGKIMVGSKHGTSTNQWVVQGIQPVVNITNDWLLVGHVDEILMWTAPDKVLYADPWIAADLLHNEIVAGRGTSTIWWGTEFNAQRDTQIADIVIEGDKKGVVQNALDESTNTATLVFLAPLFAPGDILRMDSEIFAVQSSSANGLTVTVSRAQAGRPAEVHTNGTVVYAYSEVMRKNLIGTECVTSFIRLATNQLQQALGNYLPDFIPVPVLFNEESLGEYTAWTANLVNCLKLNDQTTYYSDPGNAVFRTYFNGIVTGAQPIDAWYMYHCSFGEIHCGTATIRELAAQPPWWERTVQQGQWDNLP